MSAIAHGSGLRITWYGHACFRVEGAGTSIVTDPYTPEPAGLGAVVEPADAVVMSSALDEAHSNAAMVPGSPQVLNALDAVAGPRSLVDGVTVEAVAAMEGSDRPDDPKANALYRFELAGIRICHMGDVGNPLTEAQLAPLRGRVDVLFALAGAGLTIALPDLDTAIAEIKPLVVIPMHFRTPSLLYQAGPVESFLKRHPRTPTVRHRDSTLALAADELPDDLTIHVLRPLMDRKVGG
jgi:L-ascorbate metabolism protein UlaG (beta-lactamase superfamily)